MGHSCGLFSKYTGYFVDFGGGDVTSAGNTDLCTKTVVHFNTLILQPTEDMVLLWTLLATHISQDSLQGK